MLEVLNSLQSSADNFELEKTAKGLLSVAIVNVGYFVSIEEKQVHRDFARELQYVPPQKQSTD